MAVAKARISSVPSIHPELMYSMISWLRKMRANISQSL
jgi:hypothetical protein